MDTRDQDLLDAAKRFASAAWADDTISGTIAGQQDVAIILVKLLSFKGTMIEYQASNGTNIGKFFKKNPSIYHQLSQFLNILNCRKNCKNCGLSSYAHSAYYRKNHASEDPQGCDKFEYPYLIEV